MSDTETEVSVDEFTNDNNSITVLSIGDTHITGNCLQECLDLFEQIYKVVEKLKPSVIVHMGDLLNDFGHNKTAPVVEAIDFLKRLSQYTKTYMITGNHEKINNSDFMSKYHPYRGIGNDQLIIVDNVTVAYEKGFKFVFVPYVPPDRYFEALDTKKDEIGNFNTVTGFYSHEEFHGVPMNSIQSIHGAKWLRDYPINISGHIHKRCKPQENIIYVGSSRQTTFAETEDKFISLFTFKKGVKMPDEECIDLQLPKKMTCIVNARDILSWQPPENAIIKLCIEGTSAELKSVAKLDYIKQLKSKNIKIVHNTIGEINTGINAKINKSEIKLPYEQRLVNDIKNKPNQLAWFHKIFSVSK